MMRIPFELGSLPFKFLIRFGQIVKELNELIGFKFIPGSQAAQHPIGMILQNILSDHNKRNSLSEQLGLARLDMFVKRLREIKEYKQTIFRDFKKKIRRCLKDDEFLSVRFEVAMAASLSRKKLEFRKPDPPDFLVTYLGKEIILECGSARLSAPKGCDLKYKIISVISGKSKKSYCKSNSA